MDIQLGVACGRCDRYSALGSEACACGHVLAVGEPPRAAAAPAKATEGTTPAPLEAKAGAEAPPSVLYDKDGLKPRWVPSATSPPRPSPAAPARKPTPSSRPRTITRTTVRAQESQSAVSSPGPVEDGVSNGGRSAPGT